ncbi:MAG TPA: glycerophosphodiester phosphodiesterase family protein [Pirellulales bacterium]|nr:glycerophosphodiester phosphodiesterase family protein [Pirellulales bacterium]
MTRAAASVVREPRVLVLAHRGDSRAAPENTLPAFASAVRLDVDLVELDYVHSADGVPIVFHDDTLDRVTDARSVFGERDVPVASKNLAALRRLDAGNWFGATFASTRIPTLEEALRLIGPATLTMIERKAGDPATLVNLLKSLEMVDRVVVTAFDWQFLTECHKLEPRLVLGALGTKTLTATQLEQAISVGAGVIGWDDGFVTEEHVERVHGRGLRAWVWTVDDPHRAQQLIAYGVDGLISNLPAQVQAVVRRVKGDVESG